MFPKFTLLPLSPPFENWQPARHVPSDVIIDASMPAMIRSSGKMWDKNGELQDTKATIPESSYAPLYSETVNFCREHGAFDPTTMGTVPNVGLMAKKAEEVGAPGWIVFFFFFFFFFF